MSKFDRKKARDALYKRTQESNDRKDGEISSKYFRTDISIPFWKCGVTKEDPHIVDIIPFIAGDNYPQADSRNPIKEGDYVYMVECWVHTNIGPSKSMILCPAKNYGKPCPICEEIEALVDEGKEYDDYAQIAPKRRCVYNIVCSDSEKEFKKGVQIWEVSHKYSEKLIQSAAKAPRGGGIVPFSDPDVGKSIAFEVLNDTYRTIQGHKLVDREEPISEDILAKALVLDQLLLLHTYDEIVKIFSGSISERKEEKESAHESEVEDKSRRRREPVKKGCPHDHEWGVDCDNQDECEDCPTETYEACGAKQDELIEEENERKRLEEEKKKAQEPSGGKRRMRRMKLEEDDIPF
jgi:hypothetical protein